MRSSVAVSLLLASVALAPGALAQAFEGPVSGTLDCGGAPMGAMADLRGVATRDSLTLFAGSAVLSGSVTGGGTRAALLAGTAPSGEAMEFRGVVGPGGTFSASGSVGARSCTLRVALLQPGRPAQPAPAPQAQPARPAPQPAPAATGVAGLPNPLALLDTLNQGLQDLTRPTMTLAEFEGEWTGTLDCPSSNSFEAGSRPVRGQIRGGMATMQAGPLRFEGRVIEARPFLLRLVLAAGPPGASGSLDAAWMATDRIHSRGIVNDLPCNLNVTRAAAPAVQAAPVQEPAPRPAQQARPRPPAQPATPAPPAQQAQPAAPPVSSPPAAQPPAAQPPAQARDQRLDFACALAPDSPSCRARAR